MSKNIVICGDGTGNEYGENNTNVVKLYQSLNCNSGQIAFYDPGVGTLGKWRLARWLHRTLKQATGIGIRKNVEDAYIYLMEKFEPEDRVFLFGFSRGAYTVRSLAGMLYKVGLLQPGNRNLVPYAWKMYDKSEKTCDGFKRTYSRICKPHFIGVWDTVGSVFGKRKRFLDVKLNPDVAHAYHAVAIDERRKKFPISLWDESRKSCGQDIQQVWFAGVHSDVGGSYRKSGLSDIALEWMLTCAEGKGLKTNANWWLNLHPDPCGKIHESRKKHWRLWRPVRRELPPGSKIHASVLIRRDQCSQSYEPVLPSSYDEVATKSGERNAD